MIFIAEIGMNHNGNFGLNFELIKQASYAGADIAKFQLGWRDGDGEINNLAVEDVEHIYSCCEYFSIRPMFSVISEKAFRMLQNFDVAEYKIASRTVVENPSLVRKIIQQNKKTYISLGFWEGSDLPFGQERHIDYLWCKSKYPAYPWDLMDLPKAFGANNLVGYSDHSVGIEIPLLAISRGATVIEKHLTLDKSDTSIRDHALSADPNEFMNMVRMGRAMHNNYTCGI